jgi:hypothetical protein
MYSKEYFNIIREREREPKVELLREEKNQYFL